MYYVNRSEIDQRLQFISLIVQGMEHIEHLEHIERAEHNNKDDHNRLLLMFAQERALHLAIETVTDIGSMIIDGFLMRDAGSYEDMVGILRQEEVFSQSLASKLLRLISLRKPLVQEYWSFDRENLHPLTFELPEALTEYSQSIQDYLYKELGAITS